MTISPTVSLGSEPDTDHPLVDTAWLADRLGDPGLRVFDGTDHLRPSVPGPYVIESGRSDHELGHIPGAAFADIPADFSNPHSGLNFTLPQHDTLAAAFAAAGMGTDQTILLYSGASPLWATRMWWMLHSAGHRRALVLDGGLAKWRAEGRAITTGRERYPPEGSRRSSPCPPPRHRPRQGPPDRSKGVHPAAAQHPCGREPTQPVL